MAIITLPYGEGLQRATGVMVVRPTSFEDLRNVHLFDGKAQVRNGMNLISTLVDDGIVDLDVTVMLAPLRSESAAMGIGYNTTGGSNREVWLNRLLIDGTVPTPVGLLGTLDAGATFVPPILVGADSDNKFFVAHDEPNPTSRIVTQIYDPGGFPNLSNLTADLDGNGQADVFFRGVVRHLSYVFGWGYGSASDPVRGDVVRVSNSGDSTIFEDFAFFEAGQQGETIMVCRSAGASLMVFKENETYEIFGYSPDTFGIRLADSLFGAVGSRLAVSIAGSVFFWSTQGPRINSGGPSQDIAVPLDIGGPDPSTLVAESDPQDAFAEYDPATRVVNFVWGRRVYALSIRNPNQPRWSYYELGETAQCGGLFFSTQSTAGGGGPPVGAPANLAFQVQASAHLNYTGQVSDGDTVTLDGRVYTWQTVLTDVNGNVQIGVDQNASEINLFHAINLTGVPGTDYALSTIVHPTMTSPSAPPNAQRLRAKEFGSAGNLIELSTTSAVLNYTTPPDPTTTLAGGVGSAVSTEVEIAFDNVGQIGAEDIEVHVSDDGGATYSFSGIFPANGLPTQLIVVTVQNQATGLAIQPLTDYKFSLRYRLGGLFSPGYSDPDPDLWDTPDFDSQGSTATEAEAIVLPLRVGDNQGLWDVLNDDDHTLTIPMVLPPGHELLDIEVFHQILEAGDTTDPDGFGPKPARGTVVQANQLRTTINAASPGYPDNFIDAWDEADGLPGPIDEQLNIYSMRFVKGAKIGPVSNEAICFLGPDPPVTDGITSFNAVGGITGVVLFVNWTNAVTPTDPRNCPPIPPSGHQTHVFARNVTQGGDWTLQGTSPAFSTNFAKFATISITIGDVIRVAINHHTRCYGGFFGTSGRFHSDWSLQPPGFYVEDVAAF